MTHSPAQILATWLMEDSAAPFTDPADGLDWPLFISVLPDGDDLSKAAAIYDTTGRLLHRIVNTGEELWAFGIQLKVRAVDYDEGFAQSEVVAGLLMELHNETVAVDASIYVIDCFSQSSRSLSLGQDERRRSLFATNGVVMLRQTA